MAAKLVFLLACLLLAGYYPAMSGITSDTCSAESCSCQSDALKDMIKGLMETLTKVQQTLDSPGCNTPPQYTSCKDILKRNPSATSGYYDIHVPNGSLVQVYCDMEGANCGGEGGWMRIGYADMTKCPLGNPNCPPELGSCPEELVQKLYGPRTLCGPEHKGTCTGVSFSSHGLGYSRVCGRLRGYQFSVTQAFNRFSVHNTITEPHGYVDGAAITYGTGDATKHIWTYAAGISYGVEKGTHVGYTGVCPCNVDSPAKDMVPPFVGNDYYCETALNNNGNKHAHFFNDDPLWDGKQCEGPEAPCCDPYPNMPWFTKALGETTTEDILLRLCGQSGQIMLEIIELYVM